MKLFGFFFFFFFCYLQLQLQNPAVMPKLGMFGWLGNLSLISCNRLRSQFYSSCLAAICLHGSIALNLYGVLVSLPIILGLLLTSERFVVVLAIATGAL